ncbi:MAG: DUF4338 domain-containing protein [Burkholderiales bacterium]|nr:DUF4338 domain-containing protein [Burkholderiales bacterium]
MEGVVRFCGKQVEESEVALIREVTARFSALSRTELAHTVCELLGWERVNGRLKARECREFLERLEQAGEIKLPALRPRRPRGSATSIPRTAEGEARGAIRGEAGDLGELRFAVVEAEHDRRLWREWMGRYHYRGFRVPYGAHVRFFVWASQPREEVVACLQFSSPAWRLAVRDRWIGWSDRVRARNLQRVVQNSRFLILPWVSVRNLASRILARAARELGSAWRARYQIEPLLLETLVEPERFSGTCYRAAGWHDLGPSSGRGRQDRYHRRHGLSPKLVFIYPLVRDFRRMLLEA